MNIATQHEKILLVDDSKDTLELIYRILQPLGYQIVTASSVTEALQAFETVIFDLVITDIKMPHICGYDLIKHIEQNFKTTEIIVITGFPSIEGAVTSIKTGADQYLIKPFSHEELLEAVLKVLEKQRLQKFLSSNIPAANSNTRYGIIGDSQELLQVFDIIKKASNTHETILIQGESGTGKELVARAIHYSSTRTSAPFIPINCGSIPENLIESELFGYVKGAFTGSIESRAGFFQAADGGTIFLDEIGETSTTMQVKLLRVLQDKTIYMVGSRNPQTVDVRIIAATNKNLYSLVQKGLFRQDLYYRLTVITIEIPPLRKRNNDILLLIRYFSQRFAHEFSKPIPSFSHDALSALRQYSWPGNIRELENIIKRLILMNESNCITTSDLPMLMRYSTLQSGTHLYSLEEAEIKHIQNVLASVNGNKSAAAKILGIDRKTLREKLKKISPAKNPPE